ncbi:hypothetical protein QFZ34_001267 [Phyllobacterium ifriqiyense]|uniref:Uncharacterized protein n=1 Tax=Phyllobacterium ifriqiyense TaxID=314238 RepID=A0ABU0S5R2_9HYPH|nr:hypothetical protein [Phyllobacterium ifriqiyense]
MKQNETNNHFEVQKFKDEMKNPQDHAFRIRTRKEMSKGRWESVSLIVVLIAVVLGAYLFL